MEKLACVLLGMEKNKQKEKRELEIFTFLSLAAEPNFNLVFFITMEQNSVSGDCRDISAESHCLKILRDTPSQISYANSKESRSVDVIALVLRFNAKMSHPERKRVCTLFLSYLNKVLY